MSKTLVVLSLFLKMNLHAYRRLFRECFRIDRCRTRDSNLYRGLYYAKRLGKDSVKNTECPLAVVEAYGKDCEFLNLVNRGKLSLPLVIVITRILSAFHQIYDATGFEIENHDSVLSRLVNRRN